MSKLKITTKFEKSGLIRLKVRCFPDKKEKIIKHFEKLLATGEVETAMDYIRKQ